MGARTGGELVHTGGQISSCLSRVPALTESPVSCFAVSVSDAIARWGKGEGERGWQAGVCA